MREHVHAYAESIAFIIQYLQNIARFMRICGMCPRSVETCYGS